MKHFKIGQLVRSKSFFNLFIEGEYRGSANSYGCYIWGKPIGSTDAPALHKCYRLMLEKVNTTQKHKRAAKFSDGDPCTGVNSKGESFSGFFVQSSGKDAWIRGWPAGISKFEPMQVYKVLHASLQKPLTLK